MRRFFVACSALALAAGSASAGSLAAPVEPVIMQPSAPMMPAAFNWAGGYAGLGLSYGRATHSTTTAPNFWPNGSGVGLGALAGYNWQSGNTVFGLEGHLSGQRMRATSATAVGAVQTDLTALASIRGRLGVAADRTLFFVTAGPAMGRVAHDALDAGLSETNSVRGMMVGVGIEQAMQGGWNLRGDLEHYRFSSRDFNTAGPGTFPDVRTRANVARVSAVFRF